MEQAALKSVFLSYATADNVFAKRVYEDLCRSGIDVWGFEEDGQVGVNFLTEFSIELRNRRYFCLLDSANARQSDYVQIECSIAKASMEQDPAFTMIPCLIQPKTPMSEWWADELFENQNLITYIDLSDYQNGIRRLCRHLGVVYCPVSQIPRDRDFREELFTAGLDRDTVAELADLYTKFRKEYAARPHIARNWMVNLITKLDDLDASTVVSPRIALAVMEAENDRHNAAAEVFGRLSKLQPADPRAWAGLGGALFYLCEYQGALDAYRRCKRLIMTTRSSDGIAHLPEIAYNTARVLLALGKPEKAWDELNGLHDEARDEVHLKAMRGRILLEQQDPLEAVGYLEAALNDFDSLHWTPPASLLFDLADCYRLLHRDAAEEKVMQRCMTMFKDDPEMFRRIADRSLYDFKFESALSFLSKAIALEPDSVIYRAELASILYCVGNTGASRQEAQKCVRLEDKQWVQTPRGNYYLGLAFYIIGKYEIAEDKLQKARRMDSLIADWPSYEQLLSKRL